MMSSSVYMILLSLHSTSWREIVAQISDPNGTGDSTDDDLVVTGNDDILQAVRLDALSTEECKQLLNGTEYRESIDTDSHLCAYRRHKGSCHVSYNYEECS